MFAYGIWKPSVTIQIVSNLLVGVVKQKINIIMQSRLVLFEQILKKHEYFKIIYLSIWQDCTWIKNAKKMPSVIGKIWRASLGMEVEIPLVYTNSLTESLTMKHVNNAKNRQHLVIVRVFPCRLVSERILFPVYVVTTDFLCCYLFEMNSEGRPKWEGKCHFIWRTKCWGLSGELTLILLTASGNKGLLPPDAKCPSLMQLQQTQWSSTVIQISYCTDLANSFIPIFCHDQFCGKSRHCWRACTAGVVFFNNFLDNLLVGIVYELPAYEGQLQTISMFNMQHFQGNIEYCRCKHKRNSQLSWCTQFVQELFQNTAQYKF